MKEPFVDVYPRYEADRITRNEDNDCAVVSLAVLTGWHYGKAHTAMRMTAGRDERQPAHVYIAARHFGFERVKGISVVNRISLSEFCSAHPRGRYWVGVAGHALAVINGRVHDHTLGLRRRVSEAYRVPNDIA